MGMLRTSTGSNRQIATLPLKKQLFEYIYLPPFLRDHWGFFIKRKLRFGCRQSYHIWRVDKTSLVGLGHCLLSNNTYCVKCSLSHTADYAGTCPKRPLISWLIRR